MRSLLVMFLAAGGLGLSAGCSGSQTNAPAPMAPGAGQDVRTSEGEPLSPPAPEENSEPAPGEDEAELSADPSDDQGDDAEGEWDVEDEEGDTGSSHDDEEYGDDESDEEYEDEEEL